MVYFLTILFLTIIPLLLYILTSKVSKSGINPKVGYIEFFKNVHRILEWSTDLLLASPSGVVVTPAIVFLADPDAIKHIAKTQFDRYAKGDWIVEAFHDFLGDGIINVNGQQWAEQRKTLNHHFNARGFRDFVMENVEVGITNKLVLLLSGASRDGSVIDFQETMQRFALDNICKVTFDVDLKLLGSKDGDQSEGEAFSGAVGEIFGLILRRFLCGPTIIWRAMRSLGVPSERRLKDTLAIIDGVVLKAISERNMCKEKFDGNKDLLSCIMFGNYGRLIMSDKYLRDVVLNFVMAGRDTMSSALTWFFWLMATRPEVEAKILEEIQLVRARHESGAGEAFTQEELREMNYLHASLSETMRLYPPVSLTARSCIHDDVLPDGTTMKKGKALIYNALAMGRMERLWGKDCNKFMPERWLDEDGFFRPVNGFRYPAFHGGPRICLGKDVAYLQMKLVAASLIERFELVVVVVEKEKTPSYVFTTILEMVGGLKVHVKERNVGC